ncbi:MAG: pitrilysin family protein [Acidobacteriota bacterium]
MPEPLVPGGTTPPAPTPVTTVSFPPIARRTLPNGLEVVVVEQRSLPWTVVVASVAIGDRDDPAGKEGLASLAARLLREGTTLRRGHEIALQVDVAGGSLEAAAHMDRTSVSFDALSSHNDLALDIVADVLSRPVFPEEEVAQAKGRMQDELVAMRGSPDVLAEELSARVTYGGHPYGRYAPSPESLARLGRRDLVGFHNAAYVPGAVKLIVAGDVDTETIVRDAARRFDTWETGSGPRATLRRPPPAQRGIHLLDRPGSVQAHLRIALPAVNRSHRDFIALEVCNRILGAGTTSRLFQNLRQRHGYTYSVHSTIEQRQLASQIAIEASVRTEVAAAALAEIDRELANLDGGITKKELAAILEEMIGQFPLSLESPHALASRAVSLEHFSLPDDYWARYRDALARVSLSDLRRVARRYALSAHRTTVVVGDAAALGTQLEKLGPVTPYAAGSMSMVSPHLGQSQ